MAAWDDYEFEILFEGIDESGSHKDGVTATLKFWGPWAARWDFIKHCLGFTETVAGPPVSFVVHPPEQYPFMPGLYALNFKMSPPMQGDGDGPVSVFVDITFGVPTWDISGEQYSSLSYAISTEMLTIPESSLKFSSDNKPVDSEVGMAIHQTEITYTRYRLLEVPWSVILPRRGTVNNATFDGNPAGTCLFLGVEANIDRNIFDGTSYWTVTYKWACRSEEWNKYPRPDTGLWDYAVKPGGGYTYAASNHSALVS
jgi:hypothetical protein